MQKGRLSVVSEPMFTYAELRESELLRENDALRVEISSIKGNAWAVDELTTAKTFVVSLREENEKLKRRNALLTAALKKLKERFNL